MAKRRQQQPPPIGDSTVCQHLLENSGNQGEVEILRFTRAMIAFSAKTLEAWSRLPRSTPGVVDEHVKALRHAERMLEEVVVSLDSEEESTTTPEMTLREAGISDARQAEYQRRMSRLLGGVAPP